MRERNKKWNNRQQRNHLKKHENHKGANRLQNKRWEQSRSRLYIYKKNVGENLPSTQLHVRA